MKYYLLFLYMTYIFTLVLHPTDETKVHVVLSNVVFLYAAAHVRCRRLVVALVLLALASGAYHYYQVTDKSHRLYTFYKDVDHAVTVLCFVLVYQCLRPRTQTSEYLQALPVLVYFSRQQGFRAWYEVVVIFLVANCLVRGLVSARLVFVLIVAYMCKSAGTGLQHYAYHSLWHGFAAYAFLQVQKPNQLKALPP